MYLSVVGFLGGLVVLLFSTKKFLGLVEKLSLFLKLSPLFTAVTLVSIGTSLPELAVSVSAIIKNDLGLALGNIVGSNISNVLLVFAVAIVAGKIRIGTTKTQNNNLLLIIVTLVFGMLKIFEISQYLTGILLIILTVTITLLQIKWAEYGSTHEDKNKLKKLRIVKFEYRDFLKLVLYLIGICSGGIIIVNSVESISTILKVSTTILGLSLTAISTSLPELITALLSLKQHQEKIATGTVLGSNIYNLIFIGGFMSFFGKENAIPLNDWIWFFGTASIFSMIIFMYGGKPVPKIVGFLLLVAEGFYLWSLKGYN